MAQVVDFESLMFQFLNSNNETHQQAENYLNQLQNQPETLIKGLFQVLLQSQSLNSRLLSSVLLRNYLIYQVLDDSSIYFKLSDDLQLYVKTNLLDSVKTVNDHNLMVQLCETINEIAQCIIFNNEWPEIIDFIFSSLNTPQSSMIQEVCFRLLSNLSNYFAYEASHIHDLENLFNMCLQAESPIYIVKAYCSLLQACQYEQIENLEKQFSKLFLMINYQLSHGSIDNSIEILICISDIIEYKASIITNIMDSFLECFTSLLSSSQIDMQIRKLCLECIIFYTESDPSIYQINNSTVYLRRVFPVFILILQNIDNCYYLPKDSLKYAIIESFDRIIYNVNNNVMISLCLNHADDLFTNTGNTPNTPSTDNTSNNWKRQFVGIILLTKVSALLSDTFDDKCKAIIDNILILRSVNELKYIIIYSLGILSENFAPHIHEYYHNDIIELLFNCIDTTAEPHLLKCSINTLTSYLSNSPDTVIVSCSEYILQNFSVFFDISFINIREDVLKLLLVILQSISTSFKEYILQYTQLLENIFYNNDGLSNYEMRGIAFVCICYIIDITDNATLNENIENIKHIFSISANYYFNQIIDIYYISDGWNIICEKLGGFFEPIIDPLINIFENELETIDENDDNQNDGDDNLLMEEIDIDYDEEENENENLENEYISTTTKIITKTYMITSNYDQINTALKIIRVLSEYHPELLKDKCIYLYEKLLQIGRISSDLQPIIIDLFPFLFQSLKTHSNEEQYTILNNILEYFHKYHVTFKDYESIPSILESIYNCIQISLEYNPNLPTTFLSIDRIVEISMDLKSLYKSCDSLRYNIDASNKLQFEIIEEDGDENNEDNNNNNVIEYTPNQEQLIDNYLSIQFAIIEFINIFWRIYQNQFCAIFKELFYNDLVERFNSSMKYEDKKLTLTMCLNCLNNLSNAELFIDDIKRIMTISLSDEENEVLILCCEIINILVEKYNCIKEEKDEMLRLLNIISKYNFDDIIYSNKLKEMVSVLLTKLVSS